MNRVALAKSPPPPPPPRAGGQPAASRLVFFEPNDDTLSNRARAYVQDAVSDWSRVHVNHIEIKGYNDTSAWQDPAYSLALSIRRANAVKAELIRDGIPADVISVTGCGDTDLLVPTGLGVREPQNRRVEVIARW